MNKQEIIRSLTKLSEQVGQVITEYHWRELAGICAELREYWDISDEEWTKIMEDG